MSRRTKRLSTLGPAEGDSPCPCPFVAQGWLQWSPLPACARFCVRPPTNLVSRTLGWCESDWLRADVGQGDVVLCAHVIYTVADIEPFVRKLEQHARDLVLVVLFQAPPQSQNYRLWE